MNHEKSSRDGWAPLQGSWEEAVLSWHEQVQTAFRRKSRPHGRSDQLGSRYQHAIPTGSEECAGCRGPLVLSQNGGEDGKE